MKCLKFDDMPRNPGTLNACNACGSMAACREAAGITGERAEAIIRSRELASRLHGGVDAPEDERRKASRRPTAEVMKLVSAPRPEAAPIVKLEEVVMSEKPECSCGCGKPSVRDGLSSKCFKAKHGMTVAKAKAEGLYKRPRGGARPKKNAMGGGNIPQPGGAAPGAADAPERGKPEGGVKGAKVVHELKSGPNMTVTITADVTHWPPERIKEFVNLVRS